MFGLRPDYPEIKIRKISAILGNIERRNAILLTHVLVAASKKLKTYDDVIRYLEKNEDEAFNILYREFLPFTGVSEQVMWLIYGSIWDVLDTSSTTVKEVKDYIDTVNELMRNVGGIIDKDNIFTTLIKDFGLYMAVVIYYCAGDYINKTRYPTKDYSETWKNIKHLPPWYRINVFRNKIINDLKAIMD